MSPSSDAASSPAAVTADAAEAAVLDMIRARRRRHQQWQADHGRRIGRSILAWACSLLLHLLILVGLLLAPVQMPEPPRDHDRAMLVELLPPPPPPPPAGQAASGQGGTIAAHAQAGAAVIRPHPMAAGAQAAGPARMLALPVAARLRPRFSPSLPLPQPTPVPVAPSAVPLVAAVSQPVRMVSSPSPRPAQAEGTQPMPALAALPIASHLQLPRQTMGPSAIHTAMPRLPAVAAVSVGPLSAPALPPIAAMPPPAPVLTAPVTVRVMPPAPRLTMASLPPMPTESPSPPALAPLPSAPLPPPATPAPSLPLVPAPKLSAPLAPMPLPAAALAAVAVPPAPQPAAAVADSAPAGAAAAAPGPPVAKAAVTAETAGAAAGQVPGPAAGQTAGQAGGQPGGVLGGKPGGKLGGPLNGQHGLRPAGPAGGVVARTVAGGHYVSLRLPPNTDVAAVRSVTVDYHPTRFEKDWTPPHESSLDTLTRRSLQAVQVKRSIRLPGGVSFRCDAGVGQASPGLQRLTALSMLSMGCAGTPPPPASAEDGNRRLDMAPARRLAGPAPMASSALPPVAVAIDPSAMCETARVAGGPLPPDCPPRVVSRPRPASSTSWAPALDDQFH